jgi:hypothetical protein
LGKKGPFSRKTDLKRAYLGQKVQERNNLKFLKFKLTKKGTNPPPSLAMMAE